MAYGPGVNEINYSDLPPTGDTVNSAFQKTQNQFDALYTGLNGDIVRASEADVNTATDTTKLVTPGTLLKGKVNGVASLNSSGKVTETELPNASETVKGVVKVGANISVDEGVVSVPEATDAVKGVVKVGANISVDEGVVSVPEATDAVKGVVKVGANISVDEGVVSVPEATDAVKGVVELATPDEVLAGTDNERAVTVKDLDYSYATIDSNRIYEGVDLETKFAAEIAGYSDVWAWIKARITAADYSGLHIGDYVQFAVGADTVEAQISGIDTYYRTGDVAIGHHIDWVSRDCLLTPRQWNTTDINNGNASNPCPYMVSNLKASLDGLVTSLPVGLQAVIVDKRMLLEYRYTGGSTLTDSISWAWNDMGKLWVPSEFEVYGAIVWGTKGFSQNGGVQYPIFGNSWKSRQKGAGHNGDRSTWWLASVHSGGSTHCCSVGIAGSPNGDGGSGLPASTALGVPLCFRIG